MNEKTDLAGGPLAEVACESGDGKWTLIFTREFDHPVERIWAAITDPQQLTEWSPFTASRDLAATGDVVLTMIDGEEKIETPSVVTIAEPRSVLEYTWDTDVLRWELKVTDTGTRLTLRHTTPDLNFISKVAAGWHICLAVAERFLDGRPIGRIVGRDAMNYGWGQLNDEYAARLGVPNTGSPFEQQ